MSTEAAHTPRFRRRAAAQFLSDHGYPTAHSTLAKLASVGGGPPFRSWGRIPLYDAQELLAWAESRLAAARRTTSEPRIIRREEGRSYERA
jgi:hypothetical protein